MASVNYLWNNRARFKFSKLFLKAWAKRFLTISEIINNNLRRSALTRKGAAISATAEIGKLKADGHKTNLTIGEYTFIGQVNMALHDKITIGKRVCINDGVIILTASHDVSDPAWNHVKKKITIEDYVWICTGAIILPGVTLGYGCVVGAGAVVSKSVEAGAIVAGNPAIPISKTRIKNLNYNPCEFLAGNSAWLKG